jgi:hypothetical protein
MQLGMGNTSRTRKADRICGQKIWKTRIHVAMGNATGIPCPIYVIQYEGEKIENQVGMGKKQDKLQNV